MFFLISSLISLLFCFNLAYSLPVELSHELKSYFSPIEAKIIKVSKNEIIINKGLRDKVNIGDYFQVLKRGQAILNPQNNEIIGHVREKQAIILIKEVYEETSVGEVIRGDGPFYLGQQVIRFKGIDASFQTVEPHVQSQIVELLPFLSWTQSESSLLKFIQKNQKIALYNHKNELLKEFVIPHPKDNTPQLDSYNHIVKDLHEVHLRANFYDLIIIQEDILDFLMIDSILLYLTKEGLFSLDLETKTCKKVLKIDNYLTPISVYKTTDNKYIILNTLLNDLLYKTYIFDKTNDYSLFKKDINLYISSQDSFLLAQSLSNERILNDKISSIKLINNEIIYIKELENKNRISLLNACFFDNNPIKKIFFHKNNIIIETKDNTLSYLYKEENESKRINCLKYDNKILFSINNTLFIINTEHNDIQLKSIRLIDENYELINIDKLDNKLILGIRDRKDCKKTYIKYIFLNELIKS